MEERAARLFEDWHTLQEVKTSRSFKMILIFDTEEEMQEALQSAFLLNHFERDKFNITVKETWRETTKVTRKSEGKPILVDPVVINSDNVDDQAHNLQCEDEDDGNDPFKDPLGSSLSTKCILDDRDSEQVIRETQHGINLADNDEASSGPSCPLGFEVIIQKEVADSLIQEKGCSQLEQEVDMDLRHKRSIKKDKRRDKQTVEISKSMGTQRKRRERNCKR
ncbi:hypothetical protein PIB30_029075 [Stylosanthes scabra]|uniref:Uncharacterized protein n=1 Tax=Stylosanthes scabra TaxID=79078 RepID=A0ABU6SBD0_9FABA|nr:hypothetical protein [Stylosanthes scabra]